jgi:metal-responsive CopG/Arc/MetJ family transcriptional regulator
MEQSITITLPADVRQALDDFIRQEGRSQDDVVGQAVKEHLFLQRYRSLRERLAAKARSQGVSTDQDVFDRVS